MTFPAPFSARAAVAASLLLGGLAACEPVDPGTNRGPQPPLSFTYDDDGNPGFIDVENELTMRSCGFAVRDPNTDRTFADGQASTSPTPTTIVVYFLQTSLAPPAPGVLAVSDAVAVEVSLPSPYGTLRPTEGAVRVSEEDGWRVIDIEDLPVGGTGRTGILNATLACGL